MTILLCAAAAMVWQDIFGTLLTQAQARNREWLAALFDNCYYLGWIVSTYVAVDAMHHASLAHRALVILVMMVANTVGIVTGTRLGKKLVRDRSSPKN